MDALFERELSIEQILLLNCEEEDQPDLENN